MGNTWSETESAMIASNSAGQRLALLGIVKGIVPPDQDGPMVAAAALP
jgi:hypothetical protein